MNKINGAIRVSGIEIDKPIYEVMDEKIISNYPTHRVLLDAARALYFAAMYENVKALIAEPQEIGIGNHSPLTTILRLDQEHSKIKTPLRRSFLEWDYNSYKLKEDAALKSEETDVLICLIYGKNAILRYKGRSIHVSSLLKVAPYMQFFLTEYPPIADSPLVSSSAFVVTAVEGLLYEPESYVHISCRTPKSKRYTYPLGLIAEGVSNFLKKEYGVNSVDVQGGGHPTAAGIRIKQKIINKIAKENNLDKFEVIDWIIKRSKL